MSSIVSRRPPFCASVSHSKERRWISIRLGTSTGLFRRAKVRRVRRASAAAKKDSFEGERHDDEKQRERARPVKIAHANGALKWAASAHGPRPRRPRMWRGFVLLRRLR